MATANANWDLARQLIRAGADVNQWDIFGEAPCSRRSTCAIGSTADGTIDPLNKTDGLTIVKLLIERGAEPNMQLFFRPANLQARPIHAAPRR